VGHDKILQWIERKYGRRESAEWIRLTALFTEQDWWNLQLLFFLLRCIFWPRIIYYPLLCAYKFSRHSQFLFAVPLPVRTPCISRYTISNKAMTSQLPALALRLQCLIFFTAVPSIPWPPRTASVLQEIGCPGTAFVLSGTAVSVFTYCK
jgi:hypothetical protein